MLQALLERLDIKAQTWGHMLLREVSGKDGEKKPRAMRSGGMSKQCERAENMDCDRRGGVQRLLSAETVSESCEMLREGCSRCKSRGCRSRRRYGQVQKKASSQAEGFFPGVQDVRIEPSYTAHDSLHGLWTD